MTKLLTIVNYLIHKRCLSGQRNTSRCHTAFAKGIEYQTTGKETTRPRDELLKLPISCMKPVLIVRPAFFIQHHRDSIAMNHRYQTTDGIPMPIVRFNRALLLSGALLAFILREPLVTTALFLLILPAALLGRRWSPIFMAGSLLFAKWIPGAATDSPEVMRFNNAIAAILLGAAQVAFLLGATAVGWVLSGIVALAAAVALCGFCFGCFLFYQFNLQRYRLCGKQQGGAV